MCWWPLWIQLTGLSCLLVSWWVRHMKITSRRLKLGGWGYQRVVKVFNFPAFSLYALNCCSVDIQLLSHVWLCDSMDCSMLGFPALHSLPELFQLLSIQSVMPFNQLILCLPPFPPAFHLSQHQSLFQWAGSLYQVAIVGELQLQHQSFQWIFRVDFLCDWLVWSSCCSRDSQESSPTPQFETINMLSISGLISCCVTFSHRGRDRELWVLATHHSPFSFNFRLVMAHHCS